MSAIGKISITGVIFYGTIYSHCFGDCSTTSFLLPFFYFDKGAVMAVIAWQLDLQLPMQSVPITTDVMNSNPAHDEVHNIM